MSHRRADNSRAPVAWQLVDESFTCFDEGEARDDDSFLQVLSRSKYLDYVMAAHGLFVPLRGPGTHYRVWTENEVIDIVACTPPSIHRLPGVFEPDDDPPG